MRSFWHTQTVIFLCMTGACFADSLPLKPDPLPAGIPATAASLYRLSHEAGKQIKYQDFVRQVPNLRELREPQEIVNVCGRLGLRAEHRRTNWPDILPLTEPFLARDRGGNWFLYRVKQGELLRLEAGGQTETTVSEAEFVQQWSHDLITLVKGPPLEPGSGPHLRFASTTHDFGAVWEGEKLEHRFPLQNIGSATLEIVDVHAGCGCTQIRIEKTTAEEVEAAQTAVWGERFFAPGESGVATFVFDTRRRRGSTGSSGTIRTNEPDKNTHRLSVTANVRVPVEVRPSGAHFGRVIEGSAATREVRIWSDVDAAFEVLSATAAHPCVAVNLKKLEPESGQKKSATYLLAICLDVTNATVGQSIQDLVVLRTNSARSPVIEVGVSAVVSHEVYVTPDAFRFGMLPPNREIGRYVNILNDGERDLKLLDVRSDLPNLAIRQITLQEGKRYQILATLQTGEHPVPVTGEVLIVTNHPEQKEIRVPVTSSVEATR